VFVQHPTEICPVVHSLKVGFGFGVTELDADEALEFPFALTALLVKVYEVP
jgi:hypothetical protein